MSYYMSYYISIVLLVSFFVYKISAIDEYCIEKPWNAEHYLMCWF